MQPSTGPQDAQALVTPTGWPHGWFQLSVSQPHRSGSGSCHEVTHPRQVSQVRYGLEKVMYTCVRVNVRALNSGPFFALVVP